MKKTLLPLFIFFLSFSVNAQWVEQTSGITTGLRSVSVIDQNIAWTGGASGVVLRTTNGGTTWTNVSATIGTTSTINFIHAISATSALVCVNPSTAGQVYRTTDGGATWTMVIEQTGGFFNAIGMSSATNGFLTGDPVGGRWSHFRTTNGGATWDSTGLFLPQNGTEAGWNNGILVEGAKMWIGTSNSRVYYSTNGGNSFTAQTMPLTNSFAICFNSANRGIVGGSTTGLVSTTDGGTTWTSIPSLGTGTIYSVFGYGSLWFHTRATNIYRSVNDGASWDTAYVGAAGTIYHVSKARNGADVAFAVKSNGVILKGTALGLPVELTSFTASAVNGQVVLNWSTATEVNNRGFEIQRRSGSGEFAPVGFVQGSGTTTTTQTYSFSEKLSSGAYSYRLKQVDFNGEYAYSSIVDVNFDSPLNYVLNQNYPNPFNPSTTIKYITANPGFVSIKVYNVLGNEVAELVNREVESGVHEVLFDASSLTSGVYFYTISAGNFTETRKMLLMK
jgi:photosystem II stability/assembly factor-like uncharacterized protein